MKRAAYGVADTVWRGCLWVKRARRVHRIDENMFGMLPAGMRDGAFKRHMRSERFALIYGRRIVRGMVYLLFLYFALVCAYWIATYAQAEGWLNPPQQPAEGGVVR